MSRPRKLTDAGEARLVEVVNLRSRVPSAKQLADELGLTELYVRQLLSALTRKLTHVRDDSRGTNC